MADYIDRVQALGYPLSLEHYDKENGNKHFIYGVESYLEYIDGLPSVDAVEVVRCRDCKYNNDGICCYLTTRVFPLFVKDTDFCKWGEKE